MGRADDPTAVVDFQLRYDIKTKIPEFKIFLKDGNVFTVFLALLDCELQMLQ